jgi:DNA phosphorothioation-associated putative methyltransferase
MDDRGDLAMTAQQTSDFTVVRRHRTAIHRVRCSRPIALALAEGVITTETSVLDYGCGRGGDVRYLKGRKIKAIGWDPHFRSSVDPEPADVVNLGYVLNVIEDVCERADALCSAFDLTRSVLVASVRVDKALEGATEFGDGQLTGAGTFQKLYTQAELHDYLHQTLTVQPHIVAPGIAYVFKDSAAEERYVANRAFTRRLEYRTDLIARFSKDRTAKRFVKLANELGRVPLAAEFKDYANLIETFGSANRVERLTLRHINKEAFEGSREQRRADILTFLALHPLHRTRPPKFSALLPDVQADVRSIFGSYSKAQDEARQFLFMLGNPDAMRLASMSSTVGKVLPTDLYVHTSAEYELPALLRVQLEAAKRLVGEVGYNVAKLCADGRAVSFLEYDRFDEDAHPALLRSVRVYLPKAAYTVRNYAGSDNPPLLHRKDSLVTAEYGGFDRFRALTEAEEKHGLLDSPDIGHRQGWLDALRAKGLAIRGHALRRSSAKSRSRSRA